MQSTSAALVSSISPIRSRERRRVHPRRRVAQLVLPAGEVDAVRVGDEPLAVRQPDDGDVEALRRADTRRCCSSCRSTALPTLPTPIIASASRFLVSKNPWWIAFSARTCCDASMTHEMLRSDAPCAIALMLMFWRPSESNTLPATPGRPFIPSPTTARIAWSSADVDLHQLLVELELELLLDRVDRRRRVGAADAEADRVLGRGLRDQHDVDASCDASVRNTRSATPGTPTIPGPRSVSSARSPTDVIPFASFPSSSAVREISVPGRVRVERVLDQDRDPLRDRRRDRRRVQHLGAEVRQLHRLFVGHLRQHERRRHDPRIGAQDAVDVGPDFDHRRADRGADDRRAVVGSVAADRRRLAVLGGADEAGDDRHDAAARAGRARRSRRACGGSSCGR